MSETRRTAFSSSIERQARSNSNFSRVYLSERLNSQYRMALGVQTFDEIYDSLPEWRKCREPANVRNK